MMKFDEAIRGGIRTKARDVKVRANLNLKRKTANINWALRYKPAQ